MNPEEVIKKIIKKWNKHKKVLVLTDIQTIFDFKKSGVPFLDLSEESCLLDDMNRFIIPVYDRIPSILLEKEKIRNIPEILILSLIKFEYENFKYFCFFQKRKKEVLRVKVHNFDSVENLVKQCTTGVCLIFNQFSKLDIENSEKVKIVKNTEEAINFIFETQISVLNIIDTGDFERYICTNLGYQRTRRYSVYKKNLSVTPKYVLEIRKSLISLVRAGVYHTFETSRPDTEEYEPNTSILKCTGVGLSKEITKLSDLINDQTVFPILALIEEFEPADARNFYTLLRINPFENKKYTQTLKSLIDDETLKNLKEQWPKIIGDRPKLRKMIEVLKDKAIFCFPIFKKDKKTGKFYSTVTEDAREKTVRFYDLSDISEEEKDLLIVFQKTEDRIIIYIPL